jgi:hypothetical protein
MSPLTNKTDPMQTNFRLLPVLALAVLATFTACKKEGSSLEMDNTAEIQAHADDQNNIAAELDEVANEANVALESNAYFGGRVSGSQNTANVCGATAVADTSGNVKTITITYNGNNCAATHVRTGTLVLSMPAGIRWKTAGAAINASFQNFKIKRLRDNKSVTINGVQTLTNVSGGLLSQLSAVPNIVHTITANNMSLTFDDNTQRLWQVARKRMFTYDNGVVLTIWGIGTAGSATNIAEWGVNRFGRAFTASITEPLVIRQDCSWRLTAGKIKHEGFAMSTVAFGLNANGVATSCPATGTYYYTLTWTGPGGNTRTVTLPY